MNATTSELAPSTVHETYDGMEYSKLPPVLFHATTAENSELIDVQGLIPNQSIPGQATAVFLSDTIAYAKFCASCQQEVEPDELVIFAVDTQDFEPGTYTSWLDKDNPYKEGEKKHEVQSTVPILMDSIRRLSETEVNEIETLEQ